MRATMTSGVLEPLSETNLAVADSTEDIRGRTVHDRDGHEFGKVDEVFIDPAERRARFVSVKSGDVLGIGGRRYLLPVEAISVAGERVLASESAERISQGPQLDGRELSPMTTASDRTDVGDAGTSGEPVPIIVEVYEYYDVDEPYWSDMYQSPDWNS